MMVKIGYFKCGKCGKEYNRTYSDDEEVPTQIQGPCPNCQIKLVLERFEDIVNMVKENPMGLSRPPFASPIKPPREMLETYLEHLGMSGHPDKVSHCTYCHKPLKDHTIDQLIQCRRKRVKQELTIAMENLEQGVPLGKPLAEWK